ncbi:MAG: alpha/beta hydrolase [Cyclobacteriaceae bacterium]|nr:alpha/beta hydrolase [Cyclobacteriaceae bacterium]
MKYIIRCWLFTLSFNLAAQNDSPNALFVQLEPGVTLEVVDWGGEGQPILFLAGLGNTAHVYDNFAHHFTDHYKVYGLTRRGYGASSQPKYGYDIPTLAQDIKGVLDSLGISKISLIGHSIAGDELTEFARKYPERVDKLIYLDAAYDRSNFVDLMQKAPYPPQAQPIMSAADSSSSLQVSAYLSRIFGMDYPESEVLATRVFGSEGKLEGAVTPDRIGIKIILGLQPPAYQEVKSPALGIFAVFNHVNELFPNYEIFDHNNKLMAHQAMEVLRPYLLDQIQIFMDQVPNGQVVQFSGADHFIFLTHEREVVAEMLKFLDKP